MWLILSARGAGRALGAGASITAAHRDERFSEVSRQPDGACARDEFFEVVSVDQRFGNQLRRAQHDLGIGACMSALHKPIPFHFRVFGLHDHDVVP